MELLTLSVSQSVISYKTNIAKYSVCLNCWHSLVSTERTACKGVKRQGNCGVSHARHPPEIKQTWAMNCRKPRVTVNPSANKYRKCPGLLWSLPKDSLAETYSTTRVRDTLTHWVMREEHVSESSWSVKLILSFADFENPWSHSSTPP
jgi:hypothetical protein